MPNTNYTKLIDKTTNYSPSLYIPRIGLLGFCSGIKRLVFIYYQFYRLHNLVTTKQADKQNIASLEKKLIEEKKQKNILDNQLQNLKKSCKKNEELVNKCVSFELHCFTYAMVSVHIFR